MSETTSIHGHEVMHLMIESAATYTRESLAAAIGERFGADARFHTCSASDMDAEGIIAFLEAKGKFIPAEGGFTTTEDKVCKH